MNRQVKDYIEIRYLASNKVVTRQVTKFGRWHLPKWAMCQFVQRYWANLFQGDCSHVSEKANRRLAFLNL